jgi:hypothetical protein
VKSRHQHRVDSLFVALALNHSVSGKRGRGGKGGGGSGGKGSLVKKYFKADKALAAAKKNGASSSTIRKLSAKREKLLGQMKKTFKPN